jgi:hypothetical protein
MEQVATSSPNVTDAATTNNSVTGLDAIAQKMAAMRNQVQANLPAETGSEGSAKKPNAPVAPEGSEVLSDNDTESVTPEVAGDESEVFDEATDDSEAPAEEQVSDTEMSEVIDFLEFAETHPNAKFKFMRNGKEIEIDAKKAASILGQGAAISEEARELKVRKSELDEYERNARAQHDGLTLAMEFTIVPQLQKAYDEIVKTQGYQTAFQQQLANAADPAQQARIRASMEQNERYIASQADYIKRTKPNVDQFYDIRRDQVKSVIDNNRKSFKDSELKNEYIFNEIREKVSKDWAGAKGQLVPGVDNIDLISSDEHLLSLIRDGLKYRDRPKGKSAGNSIAALTGKASKAGSSSRGTDEISSLREKANKGDKKAQDDLLVAHLRSIRSRR